MAYITEMPRRRGGEAVVAIVGPLVSFAISVLLWLALRASPGASAGAQFLVGYLALVNLLLGAFNLLPALPLDGGRVLRSLLALAMPHAKATRIAGGVSKVVAVMLGIYGLAGGNMFLLFIAFFIFVGVQGETQQSVVLDVLAGLHVSDLMTRELKTVPPWLTVGELTRIMLDEHHLGFPVVDEREQLVGLVTLRDLPSSNAAARVGEVMNAAPTTISEDASATDAFKALGQLAGSRLIVTDRNGRMSGIITGSDLMRAIRVRTLGREWSLPRRTAV
jgi:CBS domain-containing protein